MNSPKSAMLALLLFLMALLVLISGCIGCGGTSPETQIIEDITPEEAYALIQASKDNPDFVILDVQRASDYEEGHIEKAINLSYFSLNFTNELDKLDRNKTYLVYGPLGACGVDSSRKMRKLGFREVYSMLGGFFQWEKKGFPTVQ